MSWIVEDIWCVLEDNGQQIGYVGISQTHTYKILAHTQYKLVHMAVLNYIKCHHHTFRYVFHMHHDDRDHSE